MSVLHDKGHPIGGDVWPHLKQGCLHAKVRSTFNSPESEHDLTWLVNFDYVNRVLFTERIEVVDTPSSQARSKLSEKVRREKAFSFFLDYSILQRSVCLKLQCPNHILTSFVSRDNRCVLCAPRKAVMLCECLLIVVPFIIPVLIVRVDAVHPIF